jgi:hypothetical protein
MPVEKFRSVEAMDRAAVRPRQGDVEAFFRHCARFLTLAPRIYPRGVFRLRSIEEGERLSARHRPAPR